MFSNNKGLVKIKSILMLFLIFFSVLSFGSNIAFAFECKIEARDVIGGGGSEDFSMSGLEKAFTFFATGGLAVIGSVMDAVGSFFGFGSTTVEVDKPMCGIFKSYIVTPFNKELIQNGADDTFSSMGADNCVSSKVGSDSDIGPSCAKNSIEDLYYSSNLYGEDINRKTKKDTICKMGGWYRNQVKYQIHTHPNSDPFSEEITSEKNIFYCSTTEDLIDMVKIPKTWENDNLHLYCNDGNGISMNSISSDILFEDIKSYKNCVVKNVENNQSIIYGLDVGNKTVDHMKELYFSEDNSPALPDSFEQIEFEEIVEDYLYEIQNPEWTQWKEEQEEAANNNYNYNNNNNNNNDDDDDEPVKNINITRYNYYYKAKFDDGKGTNYIFYYNNQTSFYFLHKEDEMNLINNVGLFEGNNLIDITDIFQIPGDFELSRIALFKKNENKKIYGYEEPETLYRGSWNQSIEPVYKINFDGYGLFECPEILSSYGETKTTAGKLTNGENVLCHTNNIHIRSSRIREGNLDGFNLFKNIILDTDHN